jgi:hypothetical protein
MKKKTLTVGECRVGSLVMVEDIANVVRITGRINGDVLVRVQGMLYPFTIPADAPVLKVLSEPAKATKQGRDETDPLTQRLDSLADVPLFLKGGDDDD